MRFVREARATAPSLGITLGWAAVMSGLAASCFVAGFDVTTIGGTTTGQGGATTSSSTTSSVTTSGGGQSCQHATWPSMPAAPDPGSDEIDFVTAMHQIDFGESEVNVGVSVGYDIDNRCTCQGEDSACLVPEWATADHCDGPDGRDNATAYLFSHLGLYTDALTSEGNTAGILSGSWTMLVRVRGYNGQPNDDQVELTIYGSPGRDNDPCVADEAPLWDGNDRWPVDVEGLMGPGGAGGVGGGTPEGGCAAVSDVIPGYDLDDARFTDKAAYVSGGVVVANLPQAGITMAGVDRIVRIKITAGFVTARIERDGTSGAWILRDGLLVGRWRVVDFFTMVGGLEYDGDFICPGSVAFELIKGEVCKYPDVASTLGGPTTPCDALSVAMAFEADPARLGMMWRTGATGAGCPPENDPANETCN